LLLADLVKNTLDLIFGLLVHMVKNNLVNLPHSAIVQARCRIINLDTSVFLGITIHFLLDNLNASLEIKPSVELIENKDYCHIQPRLCDESGNLLYERRKSFPITCTIVIFI